jgi:hypothetical protein
MRHNRTYQRSPHTLGRDPQRHCFRPVSRIVLPNVCSATVVAWGIASLFVLNLFAGQTVVHAIDGTPTTPSTPVTSLSRSGSGSEAGTVNTAGDIPDASLSWSKPIQLSTPSSWAGFPAIAADSTGAVHAMWSERNVGERMMAQGSHLKYARFDGSNWTISKDVLASPGEDGAEAPSLAVTPDGFIHVVWGSGGSESKLLYARAPVCCADKAGNWSHPIVLGSAVNLTTVLIVDSKARLHAAFASLETHDIYYLRSDDSGLTWQLRRQITGSVRGLNEIPVYPSMTTDQRGWVHLVWSTYPWPGVFVMYARSEDGGDTWSTPEIIDRADSNQFATPDYGPINISVYASTDPSGRGRVHLIWDGPPTVERNYVFSDDGGKTWSRRHLLFPEITKVGRAGFNPLVMDSSGTLHAFAFSYHSVWMGAGWLPVSNIFKSGRTGEYESAVLTLGNRVNVIWQNKYDDGDLHADIAFSYAVTSGPQIPPKPLPSVPHAFQVLQPIAYGARSDLELAPAGAALVPAATPTLVIVNTNVVYADYNPMYMALIGVVPTVLFVAILVVVKLVHTRRV